MPITADAGHDEDPLTHHPAINPHMLKADGGVLVWGDMMPPAEPDRNIKVVVFEEALPVTGLPKLFD